MKATLGTIMEVAWVLSLREVIFLSCTTIGIIVIASGNLSWDAVYPTTLIAVGFMGTSFFNNIYDVEIDKISKPVCARTVEKIGRMRSHIISIALILTPFFLSFFSGRNTVILSTLLAVLLAITYSSPPFRFRNSILKPIITAYVFTYIGILSYTYFSTIQAGIPIISLLTVVGFMSSIIKDFRDLESDQLAEFKTLFVRLGAKKSYYVFLTLILLCDVVLLHFATFLSSFSLLSVFYLIAIPIQAITFLKIYSMKDAIYELETRKRIIRLFAKNILLQLFLEWVLYFGGKEIPVI